MISDTGALDSKLFLKQYPMLTSALGRPRKAP